MTITDQTQLALPVLDISKANDPATANEFVAQLREATASYGFFYLSGHGIPAELQARLIAVSRAFFALPEAAKVAIDKVNSRHFRGYSRLGNEFTRGASDHREQIDIGPERAAIAPSDDTADWATLIGPNQWPEALPDFRETLNEWATHVEQIARTLLASWLQSLGQSPHLLDAEFSPANELIKVVRYPEVARDAPTQGVGAHKDGGVLTLLFVEPGKAGLQVEHHGQWIDAPPLDGAFIVNIGEMLEVATSGYLKATSHRVVSQSSGGDRISVPYFFNPNFDATFPAWELPEKLAAQAPGITKDPLNPIYPTYGLNVLKSRLRSHPDVAAAHHPDLIGKYNS